jgi:hypothetical protein
MHPSASPQGPRASEDVLRSLGAVLDSVHARSVLLRESDDGFVLHAQVAATLQDRLEGHWTPFERRLTVDELARYQREAIARRGTGHVAGPHERGLRMIGRHIDQHGLRDIALYQHQTEGRWLLWHGGDPADGPALITLDDDRLLIEDTKLAVARAARQKARTRSPERQVARAV